MRRNFGSFSRYSKLLENNDFSTYLPRIMNHENMRLSVDHDTDALTTGLSSPIFDMLDRGGKHWRSTLCLITSQLFGCPTEPIIPLAQAIELIHAGSLICDDIEDKSEKRRGKPCTYKIFGIDRALNAGNFLYFYPLRMITSMKASEETKNLILRDYSDEMVHIHLGQCTDIEWNNSGVIPTEAQYLCMVSNKTAVLARLAVKFALRLCAQTEQINSALIRHAENIGISFQIWDDIINLESEEYAKGRSYLGEDITEGKKTLIVIKALENKSKSSERLKEIINLRTNDNELIGEALRIIKESGAVGYCKNLAEKMIETSWKDIEGQIPDNEAKQDLFHLSFMLINRKA